MRVNKSNLYEFKLIQPLADLVAGQEEKILPRSTLQRILAQTRAYERSIVHSRVPISPFQLAANIIGSVLFAFLMFILLWILLKPGVMLQWETNGNEPASYRVYRSKVGSNEAIILTEIPAQTGVNRYTFTDPVFIPGRIYSYFVQGVGQAGQITHSPQVIGNTWEILPSQLALFITSLLSGLGMALILYRSYNKQIGYRRVAFL
jgi:hypothetical protein